MGDHIEIRRARVAGEGAPVGDTALMDGAASAAETGPAPGSRLPLAAALAASAALAACGGSGGGDGGGVGLLGLGGGTTGTGNGNGGTGTGTGDSGAYIYTQAKTDAEAARFLLQTQLSASEAEIASLRSKTYAAWLAEQFAMPATQTGWDWINSKAYNTANVDDMIWRQLMTSTDGMRKRMALALSEIFVVSANEIGSSWPSLMMAGYWDLLVKGVTGNFRTLLEDVTLAPAMGFYLNTKGNQKENASTGRQPDENYAREVMQLMSIGLVQLNADGTARTGADGAPLDSYTQDDVTNLARVFTGYELDIRTAERNAFTPPGETFTIETKDWTRRPMALTAANHSTLAVSFLATTIPAGTPGAPALKTALDTLYNHPNVGPFIGKQLIQRLVTSNPSPAYVARVAAAFANNGAGVRGDMKAVFAAVLLDNEARSPAGLADSAFGRLREPMLRFVQWGRTFGLQSALDTWKIGDLSQNNNNGLGQSPLRSPSVFNFFRPGYVPPSTGIAASKLVAPEFQIVNETSVGGYLNFMQNRLQNGFNSKDVVASYTEEKALAPNPAALVARLNLLMTANQLSAATVSLMVGALASPEIKPAGAAGPTLDRVCAAVLMVLASAEYLVQK